MSNVNTPEIRLPSIDKAMSIVKMVDTIPASILEDRDLQLGWKAKAALSWHYYVLATSLDQMPMARRLKMLITALHLGGARADNSGCYTQCPPSPTLVKAHKEWAAIDLDRALKLAQAIADRDGTLALATVKALQGRAEGALKLEAAAKKRLLEAYNAIVAEGYEAKERAESKRDATPEEIADIQW